MTEQKTPNGVLSCTDPVQPSSRRGMRGLLSHTDHADELRDNLCSGGKHSYIFLKQATDVACDKTSYPAKN